MGAFNTQPDVASVDGQSGTISGSRIKATSLPQMIATRCGLNSGAQFPVANAGCESRIQHCLPYGAKSLYPIYAGFYVTASTPDTETTFQPGYGYYAVSAVVVSGGTGYARGDLVSVSGAGTNQFAPTLQVDSVSGGVVTGLSVVDGGGFGAKPSTGLSTTASTGSGTGLTVTLTTSPTALVAQVGIEQTWGDQYPFSQLNFGGVMRVTAGASANLGKQNIAIPYGDFVKCDSIDCGLAAGSLIGSRIYTPGTGFYVGRYLSGSAGLNEESNSAVNITDANPYSGPYPTHSSPAPGFQPIAIMGIPLIPGPTYAIIGDSIGYGTISVSGASTQHEAVDANGNSGYIERAINQQAPFANFCTPSDRIEEWLLAYGATLRMRLLNQLNLSHVIDQMGINDLFGGGVTYATFKSYKIKLWQMLMGLGIKEIFATCMFPVTSSTDSWATTGNQSATGATPNIISYNTDLRNGVFAPYGVTRVLDATSAVETSKNSGVWSVGSTLDGLHPTQSASAAAAAVIGPVFAGVTL